MLNLQATLGEWVSKKTAAVIVVLNDFVTRQLMCVHFLQDESEKLWLAQLIEKSVLYWTLENESKRQNYLAKLLLKSEVHDL